MSENNRDYENRIWRYRCICLFLSLLCLSLFAVILVKTNKIPVRNNSSEKGITLCGKYQVGEGEELTPGRYNIFPVEGEGMFSIGVSTPYTYYDEETGTEQGDVDYDFLWDKAIYGYKLEEGMYLRIDEPGARFQKIGRRSIR